MFKSLTFLLLVTFGASQGDRDAQFLRYFQQQVTEKQAARDAKQALLLQLVNEQEANKKLSEDLVQAQGEVQYYKQELEKSKTVAEEKAKCLGDLAVKSEELLEEKESHDETFDMMEDAKKKVDALKSSIEIYTEEVVDKKKLLSDIGKEMKQITSEHGECRLIQQQDGEKIKTLNSTIAFFSQEIIDQKAKIEKIYADAVQEKTAYMHDMGSELEKTKQSYNTCSARVIQVESQLSEEMKVSKGLKESWKKERQRTDSGYPRFETTLVAKSLQGNGLIQWTEQPPFVYNQPQFECQDCIDRPAQKTVDGWLFMGQWNSAGQPEGRGTRVGANQADSQPRIEEGYFRAGKLIGEGRSIWQKGHLYEGEFLYDQRHGRGAYTWENGEKYEGDWVKDKKQGRGQYTWPNGRKYDGEYKDDKRSGYGTFTWACLAGHRGSPCASHYVHGATWDPCATHLAAYCALTTKHRHCLCRGGTATPTVPSNGAE